MKIAIGGKGGVGKTTVCTVWARFFADKGFDVLAIDADSDTNLAAAFGVTPEASPTPLIGMKQLIAERTGTDKNAAGAYFRLNPKVSDLPEKYWTEVNGIKLLALGQITRAGTGCACPEAAFLKAMLSHTVLHRGEAVLVDLAAGVEFMGRACVQGIDAMVVVVEPGSRSIDTALNIAKMARTMGIGRVAALANKITNDGQIELIESRLGDITLLGSLRHDISLQEADFEGKPVFQADTAAIDQLNQAGSALMELIGCNVDGPGK